jgi:AraC family transcriptional regulator
MVNPAISTIDFANQEDATRVLPQAPLIDSYCTGWKGLTFTHYCHPPHETVEHCLLQHSLVITDPKSCFQAERRLDGKFKHYAHGNGRLDVIPAFLNHWTNWNQEVEFSVIAICPTLLNQTTQELMQREIKASLATTTVSLVHRSNNPQPRIPVPLRNRMIVRRLKERKRSRL